MDWKRIAQAFGGLLLGVSICSAQHADTPGNDPAPSSDLAARSHVYRLDFESFYETDTGPCDIPSAFSELIRGTMNVSFGGHDASFQVHRVRDVNWLLTVGEEETRVSGHGTLWFGGGLGPLPLARLTLTLRWGDERDVVFDSGFVPVEPGLTPAIDLTVREVDAEPCWTRIVRVAASIVPRSQMIPYRLRDSAVWEQISPTGYTIWRPLDGHFRLVELPLETNTQPPVHEAAVVSVLWTAPASALADWPLRVQGAGLYRLGTFGVPTVVEQRLEADLTLIEGRWVSVRRLRFDSGLQPFNSVSWLP
ncbi:MAG: hypothetical protein K8E66_05355, partial [Phycisphaerales bacterium]|nr:hypothetical protein [Phycisphaerales bacterium]